MSLKRLTVISAVGSHNSFNNQTISYVSSYSGGGGGGGGEQSASGSSGSSNSLRTSGGHHQGLHTMRPGANLHGNVNIMLGGAMLSVVITVVCFVCYCCHRNIKKRSNSLYRQQWLETEANMEIYSVEQCYDAPAASGGGYFMDGGGAGDYQSLPMVGSTINHNGQLPFPYHHLHQQHYTPYPNGPPPSYDTVVAHDELLACAVSCRGKPRTNCPAAVAEDVAESGCSLEGAPDECKSSCTEALLRKATARARFADGTHHHHHRRGLTRRDVSPNEANDRDVTEPFWRSIELEEAERQEEQREAGEVLRNCGCTVSGRSNGSPIYCPGCGCHVAAETGGGHRVQIDPSTNATTIAAAAAGPSDTPLDWLDGISNGPLLVDYDSSTTVGATPSSCSIPVERSNGMEGGGNSAIVTPATHNNNNNNNNDDSDILTMETATLATLPSPSTVRLDTMNNNDATLRGDTRACPAEPSANEASRRAANENNNVITGPPRGDASLIEILIDQRQTDGAQAQDTLQQQRTEDLTNGNGNPGAPGEPQSGIRQLLDENGLVRLDMSQIIDNTGLPTYEAALKLESSGQKMRSTSR